MGRILDNLAVLSMASPNIKKDSWSYLHLPITQMNVEDGLERHEITRPNGGRRK
jgi:hypothetical protein